MSFNDVENVADRLYGEPLKRNFHIELLFCEEYEFNQCVRVYSDIGKTSIGLHEGRVNANLVWNDASKSIKNFSSIR